MAKTYGAADGDGKDKGAEDTDDIASRFPSVDDERLRTPRGRDLPEPPKVEFTPPTLPQVQVLREDTRGGVSGSGYGSNDLRGAGLASAAGVQLFVAIAVCTGLGWLVDSYVLHTKGTPWGLIVGFFLGVVTGFMNLFRLTAQLNRDDTGSGGQSDNGSAGKR